LTFGNFFPFQPLEKLSRQLLPRDSTYSYGKQANRARNMTDLLAVNSLNLYRSQNNL